MNEYQPQDRTHADRYWSRHGIYITYKQIGPFTKFSGEVHISSNPAENGPVNDAGALFTGEGNPKRINSQIQALAASDSSTVDYRNKDQSQTCCNAASAVNINP